MMYSQALPTHSDMYLQAGYRLNEKDIVCGRGKANAQHPGNIAFISFMKMNLERYKAADTRMLKSIVVTQVTAQLFESGMRFLKLDTRCNLYHVLTSERSHEKVGHAIRDLLKNKKTATNKKKSLTRRRKSKTKNTTRSSKTTSAQTNQGFNDIVDKLTSHDSSSDLSSTTTSSSSSNVDLEDQYDQPLDMKYVASLPDETPSLNFAVSTRKRRSSIFQSPLMTQDMFTATTMHQELGTPPLRSSFLLQQGDNIESLFDTLHSDPIPETTHSLSAPSAIHRVSAESTINKDSRFSFSMIHANTFFECDDMEHLPSVLDVFSSDEFGISRQI